MEIDKIIDPLLPRTHINDLLKLRQTSTAMKAVVDQEIILRHKRMFDQPGNSVLSKKSIGLMIKDLITDEIREKLSTNFADLETYDVGYGLLLLDPPTRCAPNANELISKTLPSSIALKTIRWPFPIDNPDNTLFVCFDVSRLISARNGMIIKYPKLKSVLIHNFHIILAAVWVKFENSDNFVWYGASATLHEWLDLAYNFDRHQPRPILEVLKLDPLFNLTLFKSLCVKTEKQTLDVSSIMKPTEALVRVLACTRNTRSNVRNQIRCGFLANKPLLNLLSFHEYGVPDISTCREDYERLFRDDRRLDENDISLLREYMEYRIKNHSIRDDVRWGLPQYYDSWRDM